MRKGSASKSVALVLFVAATAALSYYGYTTRAERDKAQARVHALQGENASLSDALELHRNARVSLDEKLTTCSADLDTEKQSRVEIDARLSSCRSSVENLEQQEQQAKAMLAEFNALTAHFRKMIDSGKLDVMFRRGQMLVKLPEQVLFPSGSATLSADGEEALKEVARIFRPMPRTFTVAGHTDNLPIKSSEFASNWELSTARALTVTQSLIRHGVRPRNLVAAGYGEFAPIASNKTAAGRSRNRRIEIILEPDLNKLPLGKLTAKSGKGGKRGR